MISTLLPEVGQKIAYLLSNINNYQTWTQRFTYFLGKVNLGINSIKNNWPYEILTHQKHKQHKNNEIFKAKNTKKISAVTCKMQNCRRKCIKSLIFFVVFNYQRNNIKIKMSFFTKSQFLERKLTLINVTNCLTRVHTVIGWIATLRNLLFTRNQG